MKDSLNRDLTEATAFRDDVRSEAKDWEKRFNGLNKERQKELSDTRRELKEKQELYGTIDSYLMRLNHFAILSSVLKVFDSLPYITLSIKFQYKKISLQATAKG